MLTGPKAVRDRDREIVRLTAELLSSGVSLAELFEKFCMLLAQFVDASVVFIAIGSADNASIEFSYDHGASRNDPRPVNPASQTQRVLQSGASLLMRSRDDFHGPLVPLRMQDEAEDDSISACFVPLRFGNQVIGVLSVQSPHEGAYDEDDLHLLETCALYVAVAVHADEIRSKKDAFESAASIDALTGVANRWAFDQHLKAEWRHARRDGQPISLVMLDIDWFKPFNDTYGHVAGDACLEQVASAMQACMTRETDLVARYGGEEFAAILCATDADGAAAVAERIRASIEALHIPHLGSAFGKVTACCGTATAIAAGESPDVLVRTADRALYAAKTAGRNQVICETIGVDAVSARSSLPGNNLRACGTTFVGRNQELAAVSRLLDAARVVTLTGPGGIGKTRLALAAAQHRLFNYLDGVWVVDLSAVRDAEFLDAAIAGVLGIPEQGAQDLHAIVLHDLRSKNRLLVFDNCEQLAAAVAALVQEVAAPGGAARMLVTSRTPLGVPSEACYELAPMEEEDATALFKERAGETDPGFEPARAVEIAALCRELGRLPLAIELAAAHVKTMTPQAIVESLGVLRDGGSAGSMIAWSYGRLTADERHLFENLSVFPASFDADAARDVCSDERLDPWDVAPLLRGLVVKHLVVAEPSERGERYRLLESVRDFAAARAHARADQPQTRRRHIGYFRAFAQRSGEQIERGGLESALGAIAGEWENIRTALHRGLVEACDAGAGRTIVLAIRRYWAESGQFAEGRHWIERALETLAPDDSAERGELLYAKALMAHSSGDFMALDEIAAELLHVYERTGNAHGRAKALNALGNAKFHAGDRARAETLYREALDGYRAAGDRRGAAVALMNLGSLEADLRLNFAAARTLFEQSLECFRDLGISVNMATVLANLGEICAHEGDYAGALSYASESIKVSERLGNESLAAWQLANIAHYRLERGEVDLAAGALRAAYKKLRAQRQTEFTAHYADGVAILFFKLGLYDLSAQIWGFAQAYRDAEHTPRLPSTRRRFERVRRSLERRLGHEAFRRHLVAGQHISVEQVDLLMQGLSPEPAGA